MRSPQPCLVVVEPASKKQSWIVGLSDGLNLTMFSYICPRFEHTVNGPFSTHNFQGTPVKINGIVDVEESIVANKEIVISISPTMNKESPIRAQLLKTPHIEIIGRRWGLIQYLARIFGLKKPISSRGYQLIEINVQIEVDEVILDGVRHTGKITSENITLKNNAEYSR